MTSPPAHLLPLALLACEDLDACEVLGDALLECGWWDERLAQQWDLSGSHHVWVYADGEYNRGHLRARAIAAVLLFGEWSTARWPLVEAHEAQLERARWDRGHIGPITPSYLVDRDELVCMYTPASGGVFLGINRGEPPVRLGGLVAPQDALADVWAQELDGAMRRYSRDVSYALTARMYAPSTPIQHPDDEEDDDADLG